MKIFGGKVFKYTSRGYSKIALFYEGTKKLKITAKEERRCVEEHWDEKRTIIEDHKKSTKV